MTMRIELVAGGDLSNKKVKRRMNNSLNFYLVLPRLTPPEIRGRQAGPCLTKKVKRKMSKALNLTSFYRCLTRRTAASLAAARRLISALRRSRGGNSRLQS